MSMVHFKYTPAYPAPLWGAIVLAIDNHSIPPRHSWRGGARKAGGGEV